MDSKIKDKIDEYVNAAQYERILWEELQRVNTARFMARRNYEQAQERVYRIRLELDTVIADVHNLNGNNGDISEPRVGADGGGDED